MAMSLEKRIRSARIELTLLENQIKAISDKRPATKKRLVLMKEHLKKKIEGMILFEETN